MHCSSSMEDFMAKLDAIQTTLGDVIEVAKKRDDKMTCIEPAVPTTKKRRLILDKVSTAAGKRHPMTSTSRDMWQPSYQFTHEDLGFILYGRTVVQPIDTEILRQRRSLCGEWFPSSPSGKSEKINIEPSKAMMSFIPQVQLCMSSLPGYEFGVCAREKISKATVIGPYNGKRIKLDDRKCGNNSTSTSFYWEIYRDDKIDHYIDGSDENASCWMRFIRSARNPAEQNLCAIQYKENIYYRAMKDIAVGSELLVWYEDLNDEYFGIPPKPSPPQRGHNQEEKKPATCPKRGILHMTYSPAMLRTMQKTKLWVDINLGADNDRNGHRSPKIPNSANDIKINDSSEQVDKNSWRCNQCSQTFGQRSMLELHVCPKQSDRPYYCAQCKISFPDPEQLRVHVQTHENKLQFKCGFCGRRFAGATTLANHIRTHTGAKPFVCRECNKCFAQASQLSRHQRILGDCCLH